MKINTLELENVKRIKAVKIEPTKDGLTIIGGKNKQGKTSVLDAIAWALGGEAFRPSKPQREGSVIPPNLKITLSNGIIVERKGKNSSLKVTDPSGKKAGQALLNEFINTLALNLPKFMNSSNKEKATTLLNIIGVGDQLAQYEKQESELYNSRLAIGRIADQKAKYVKEMVSYPDAPKEMISPSELIRQQQEILARNGENQRKREKVGKYRYQVDTLTQELDNLKKQTAAKQAELDQATQNLSIATMDATDLVDESTEELEKNIQDIEIINAKVRANFDKEKADDEAKQYQSQYTELTNRLNDVRKAKMDLLNHADLPLQGLSVDDGELTYNGQKWDNMSGSEQLKVSTAIVRKLNPECEFVLLDKLEQMDLDTLNEFNEWLETQGLQVIATRVSTGDECSVIIEDGYAVDPKEKNLTQIQPPVSKKTWKAGEF